VTDDIELTEECSKSVADQGGGASVVSLHADPRRERLFLRLDVDDSHYSGQVELTEDEMQKLVYTLMDPLRIDRLG
jgi:hypothetical protein